MTDIRRGHTPPANNDDERRTSPRKHDAYVDDDGFEEVAASTTVSAQGTSTAASVVVGDDAEAYEFVDSPTSRANSSAMGSSQAESPLEQPENEDTVDIEYDSPKEQPNIGRKRRPTTGNRVTASSSNTFIDMQSFDDAIQINRDVDPDTGTHGSVFIGGRAYDNSVMICGGSTPEEVLSQLRPRFQRRRRGEN
ncbi:hypothetical protein B9479_007905 [Cryptococcus floricola]|uniref:Uncharacterized protein n=1 Tax=Cryptococcus floricola TaxID=2591691 RepID=A0A5D3AMV6_9TREE|nr:hypothetical protein B9479_007905 [Cryptococcus floricola]